MAGRIVYGVRAVTEALRAGRQVNRLYLVKGTGSSDVEEILALARDQKVPFDFVPPAKLSALAETREHQGVAAAVSPVAYATLDACLDQCGDKALLLVLDRIQHPKNLGLLLRTAVCAGASGVLVTARGGALLDESVVRASAGAVFHVPVVNCGNLPQALRQLKRSEFWIYGLAAEGEASVFGLPWPDRCALILGNESEGLRPGVRKVCDELVRIPLAGGFDSLNAAVAAGVALFQAASGMGLVGK